MKNFTSIPVVDISGLYSESLDERITIAQKLGDAATNVGFVYIVGHHIKLEVLNGIREVAKDFFILSMNQKMQYYIGNSKNHKGYVPEGEEVFQDNRLDHKEAFNIGKEFPSDHPLVQSKAARIGPNNWPDSPVNFKYQTQRFFEEVLKMGSLISRGFALALDLPEFTFEELVAESPSMMRMIHYPKNPEAEDTQGIGAHTDFDLFTMLLAGESGLEVLNDNGIWIDAPPVPGAFIVNTGEFLEVMTAGRFVATTHRVRSVKEERYSFPVFYTLNFNTVVKPLPQFNQSEESRNDKYKPFVSGEHAWNQTIQTFRYLRDKAKRGEVTMGSDVKSLSTFGTFRATSKA